MYSNYKIIEQDHIKDTDAEIFLKTHHYLPSLPRGCNKVYCLYIKNKLCGVAAYGSPVSNKAKEKYNIDLELKRFCLSPNLLKNSGSWFMGNTLRDLKRKGHIGVISYADPSKGHTGSLYKASNYQYLGVQKYPTGYILIGNKKVYGRNIYSNKFPERKFLKLKWEEPKHIFKYSF
jgi:hypothetical protein